MKTKQEIAEDFRMNGSTPRDALLLAVHAYCENKLGVTDPGTKQSMYNKLTTMYGIEEAIDFVAEKLAEGEA